MIRLAALVLVFFLLASEVRADHNGPLLPYLPTPVLNRVMDTGRLTYRLDSNSANYPNFSQQAAETALHWAVRMFFAGLNVELVQIHSGQPDVWMTMPDDRTFLSICGQGAAACVSYWSDPVYIWYRRALLYTDWRTTVSHELGHVFGLHEQYYDATMTCKSLADLIAYGPGPTVMSCGTGLWRPEPFDLFWVYQVLSPQPVMGAAVLGSTVWYAATTHQARLIAVIAEDQDGGRYLASIGAPCFSAGIVCGGAPLPPLPPGTRIYVKAQNQASFTYGEVFAGEIQE